MPAMSVGTGTGPGTVIAAENLGHAFDDGHWLFRNWSFTVERGTTAAIVGPSGSGKSTMLAILGRELRPRQGTVRIESSPRSSALRLSPIAWVFQTSNVVGALTVRSNVALPLYLAGESPVYIDESVAAGALAVGIDHLLDRSIRTLSGGELQRVGVARALVSNAELILADEPTGSLDRDTTDRVADALLTPDQSRAVIVVTHDQRVARRCDLILDLGAETKR